MQKRNLHNLNYISANRRLIQVQEDFESANQQSYEPYEKPKGIFSKLKDNIYDLLFEEAEVDRPIGISQLTKKTFQATDEFAAQSFFKSNNRTVQDYRFNQLVNSTPKY